MTEDNPSASDHPPTWKFGYPVFHAETRAEWRGWLEANHSTSGTIWLVRWKKSVAEKYIPYDEMVEEALCFGWIDSVQHPLDEQRSLLRMSRRKKGAGGRS